MHPIASIELREHETLLINIKEFEGIKYIDARVFFNSQEQGIMLPSKKGFTINVTHLDELIKGLTKCKDTLAEAETQDLSGN